MIGAPSEARWWSAISSSNGAVPSTPGGRGCGDAHQHVFSRWPRRRRRAVGGALYPDLRHLRIWLDQINWRRRGLSMTTLNHHARNVYQS